MSLPACSATAATQITIIEEKSLTIIGERSLAEVQTVGHGCEVDGEEHGGGDAADRVQRRAEALVLGALDTADDANPARKATGDVQGGMR